MHEDLHSSPLHHCAEVGTPLAGSISPQWLLIPPQQWPTTKRFISHRYKAGPADAIVKNSYMERGEMQLRVADLTLMSSTACGE